MRFTNYGFLVLLVALTTSTAFGQKTRPRTNVAKPKVVKAEPKPTPAKTGKIDLEAGLIFNSGDVKPVGRATFYLLKEDASKVILTQEHLDAHNQDI